MQQQDASAAELSGRVAELAAERDQLAGELRDAQAALDSMQVERPSHPTTPVTTPHRLLWGGPA